MRSPGSPRFATFIHLEQLVTRSAKKTSKKKGKAPKEESADDKAAKELRMKAEKERAAKREAEKAEKEAQEALETEKRCNSMHTCDAVVTNAPWQASKAGGGGQEEGGS